MRPTNVLLHLAAVISSLLTVDANDIDQSHNINAKYLSNVTIKCEDSTFPDTYTISYWVLPNMELLKGNESLSFKTLDGTAQWKVNENGSELQVVLLYENHFGLYYCHVEDAGEYYVMRRGINYYGAYFGDLWPEYMWPVIIGCSAAGTILLLFTTICIVKELQWKPHKERSPSIQPDDNKDGLGDFRSDSSDSHSSVAIHISNKGFVVDDDVLNSRKSLSLTNEKVMDFMAGSRSRKASSLTTKASIHLNTDTYNQHNQDGDVGRENLAFEVDEDIKPSEKQEKALEEARDDKTRSHKASSFNTNTSIPLSTVADNQHNQDGDFGRENLAFEVDEDIKPSEKQKKALEEARDDKTRSRKPSSVSSRILKHPESTTKL